MTASYQSPPQARRQSIAAAGDRRSAFGAAFLSFLFPGLGQAYAGAPRRGLGFALAPLLLAAVFAAIFLHYGTTRFGLWLVQSSVLAALFVLNLILLAYRAVAVVDAYRIAQYANAFGTVDRGLGPPRLPMTPASLAGLAAVLLVLAYGHFVVARWDVTLYNLAVDTHTAPPPIAGGGGPLPTGSLAPIQATPPPRQWTGQGRLNILLLGVDERHTNETFNTDTMIVVSIDPESHRTAMFSLPRDTLGLPTPPRSALASLFGPTYDGKINGLWQRTDSRRELFPNGGRDALKQELGFVFGLDIQYYVEVNFDGFRQVVDTLGGVTVNVENPVVDDNYPGDGGKRRVYIPSGIQHMSGTQALIYARSRHGSSDFDRAARQQQILVALKDQANLGLIAANQTQLITQLGQTVHTDIPEGPDVMGALIDLAGKIKTSDIRQFVFSPPTYGTEHPDPSLYWIEANVPKIRAAVQEALSGGAPQSSPLAGAVAERAPITVENGTGLTGQATEVVSYLQAQGLNAHVSPDRPAKLGGPTRVVAVNGAETQYPDTVALLQQVLGVTPDRSTIAGQPPGFILVTGSDLPALTPAASPSP